MDRRVREDDERGKGRYATVDVIVTSASLAVLQPRATMHFQPHSE